MAFRRVIGAEDADVFLVSGKAVGPGPGHDLHLVIDMGAGEDGMDLIGGSANDPPILFSGIARIGFGHDSQGFCGARCRAEEQETGR